MAAGKCGNRVRRVRETTGVVNGMVTYSSKPVTEGWVSFRDTAKGMVAAMSLGADGATSCGSAAASTSPWVVCVTVSPPAPTDEEIDAHEIRNFPHLPEKYREPFTSPSVRYRVGRRGNESRREASGVAIRSRRA